MPKSRNSAAKHGGRKGNFAESRNGLLSLFSDPDGRGERSWRETFGYERRPVKPEGGQPFIAREAPISSSDSK
jgi:hypothetical protein